MTVSVALHKFHQSELVELHVEIAFQRRRGGAQQGFRAMDLREHHRGVAGMVTRGGIHLLVGAVMLLVHDDQPQIPVWQQQSRPCPENQLVLGSLLRTAQNPVPDFHPFVLVKA